ncbi:MAG: hypothetical protein JSU83_14100 [Deltaproteobacteria bacterium]|nr:MAG: hypothetical protein JSU83_14100 [Deltaproteobacteria bacterium]
MISQIFLSEKKLGYVGDISIFEREDLFQISVILKIVSQLRFSGFNIKKAGQTDLTLLQGWISA